jgi:hypothetical protein
MDSTVVVALIAAVAAVTSATIGAIATLKKKSDSHLTGKLSSPSIKPSTISQTGSDNSKQIITESIGSGTIVQANHIESLQLSENKPASSVDLRLVDITILEPIVNYPILEASASEQRSNQILINPLANEIAALSEGFPVLDIKLRNAGTETVVLKKAEFKILKVGRFKNPRESAYKLLPVSWNYTVLFSSRIEEQTVTADISHALKPNDAERFAFTIGQSAAPVETPVWYYFQLHLFFNEDDRSICSDPILISVPSQTLAPGQTQFKFYEDYLKENRKIVQQFAKLPGQRSEGVQMVIDAMI